MDKSIYSTALLHQSRTVSAISIIFGAVIEHKIQKTIFNRFLVFFQRQTDLNKVSFVFKSSHFRFLDVAIAIAILLRRRRLVVALFSSCWIPCEAHVVGETSDRTPTTLDHAIGDSPHFETRYRHDVTGVVFNLHGIKASAPGKHQNDQNHWGGKGSHIFLDAFQEAVACLVRPAQEILDLGGLQRFRAGLIAKGGGSPESFAIHLAQQCVKDEMGSQLGVPEGLINPLVVFVVLATGPDGLVHDDAETLVVAKVLLVGTISVSKEFFRLDDFFCWEALEIPLEGLVSDSFLDVALHPPSLIVAFASQNVATDGVGNVRLELLDAAHVDHLDVPGTSFGVQIHFGEVHGVHGCPEFLQTVGRGFVLAHVFLVGRVFRRILLVIYRQAAVEAEPVLEAGDTIVQKNRNALPWNLYVVHDDFHGRDGIITLWRRDAHLIEFFSSENHGIDAYLFIVRLDGLQDFVLDLCVGGIGHQLVEPLVGILDLGLVGVFSEHQWPAEIREGMVGLARFVVGLGSPRVFVHELGNARGGRPAGPRQNDESRPRTLGCSRHCFGDIRC